MKVLKKVLTLLLFFFAFTSISLASEDLKFGWKNDNISAEWNESIVEISDGYILGGYNEDFLAHIVKFNNNGEEVASKTIDDQFTVVALKEKDNKYYAVVLDDNFYISVYILDTNLEILDQINTSYYLNDWNDIVYFNDDEINITSLGWYQYEGIASEDSEYLLMSFDYDLNYELIEYSENSWEDNIEKLMNYFPYDYYLLFSNYSFNYGVPIMADSNEELSVVVGKISPNDNSGTFIFLYDENGDVINYRNIKGVAWWYTDVLIVDNYIYAVGNNYNYIDVYDFEGELVKQIDVKDLYPDKDNIHISVDTIAKADNGFVASYVICDVEDGCAVNCKDAILKYQGPYNVYTKTDGNGTVTISKDKNYSGDNVTFVITPNEGYVLGAVKVTDSKGNVLTFTDYVFSMPDANVTIEVSFVKENPIINPETADIWFFLGVIAIISFSLLIYFRKKNLFFR